MNFIKIPYNSKKRLNNQEKINLISSPILEERIIKLNEDLKKEGIELIIFLPPINRGDLDLSFLEKNNIPILDFYDPHLYPEFYQSKNLFDIGHLNKKGAELLSEKFAKQLNQLIQK